MSSGKDQHPNPLTPTTVLGRDAHTPKREVVIPGIGSALYDVREYRAVRRLLAWGKKHGGFREQEATAAARVIHEAKVFADATLVTGPEDDRPVPAEPLDQLELT